MSVRIAIPMPTSGDQIYNRQNWSSYAEAVIVCGATPVEFPLSLNDVDAARMAASCDGILLPGSPADVDPARYGQEADPASASADPAREATDRLLLEDAYRYKKPVLAICFGMQFLNVWRGGTLIQDVTVLPVNHSAGRAVAVAHTVAVAPGSLLESLVEATELQPGREVELRLPVNSSHHQAIGCPGQGLKITSRCQQDAVVESVELERNGVNELDSSTHFVLGVQWHPERTFASSATSAAIFHRFVLEATRYVSRHAQLTESNS